MSLLRRCTVASALLLASHSFAANPPSFLTAKTFSVGQNLFSNPVSVADADLNGDGKLDLVVADQGTGLKHIRGFVVVLLGNGDGTFKPGVEYAAGGVPEFIATADLNNDGKIDLIVANYSSNNVSVLLGNGDGTFQTHMDFGTVNQPTALAIGDFNNDGILDVASTDADSTMRTHGSVAVLLGNGDGTLQPAVSTYEGAFIQWIASGDFNGDGKLDLVVGNKDLAGFKGNLSYMAGNGDGTFEPPAIIEQLDSVTFLVAADFNLDGHVDIATNAQVLLGNGDGTFGSPINLPAGVGEMAVGDLNGDGVPDLAVINDTSIDIPQGTAVSVYYGVGDGTFLPGQSYYSGGSEPSSLAIGDFNGDHHPDVVVTNQTDANVAILFAKSQRSGLFRSAPTYPDTGQFTFADFNDDHIPDMAAAHYINATDYELQVFAGNGDGTFQTPATYSFAHSVTWVVTGDFNDDGHEDLAIGVADYGCLNPSIVIMLGNGNGTFGSPATYTAGGCTNFIATGDLNGDGKLDLLTPSTVLLGNGDGTFQNPISYSAGSETPTRFVIGDFNRDGKLDLAAIASYQSSVLSLLLGNGDGTFQSPITTNLKDDITAIAAADLNGDGELDLAVTTDSNTSKNSLLIFLGNGDGTFTKRFSESLVPYSYGIAIADLNRDGKLDVAVAEFSLSGKVAVFSGNGDGTLQAPITLDIDCPTAVVTSDLNLDGVPDLIVQAAGPTVFINSTP